MSAARRTALAGLALAVAATLAPSVPAAADPDRSPVVRDLGPTTFTKRGPYAVGETTIALPTNDAPVEVWYPTRRADVRGKKPARYDLVDWLPEALQARVPEGTAVEFPSGGVRGVSVAKGRFPLVVFSHGFAGFRTQSSFLTSWLASWGFVVAAPDHLSRSLTAVLGGGDDATSDVEDLRATITLMRTLDARRSGRFAGHVDTARVGAVGHSAGGSAVQQLAAADRRVDTFVALAGASDEVVPRKPGLIMAGATDAIIELDRLEAAYADLRKPKRLVVLADSGHHAFSDLCEVGDGDGGLVGIAQALGIPVPDRLAALATDGCLEPSLPVRQAWPAVRQVTIAHLRNVLAIDRSRAGLSGLRAAFPGLVSGSRSAR